MPTTLLLHRLSLLTLALICTLAGTQCTGPKYREVRRKGPDGAYYVQRIRITPEERRVKKERIKKEKKKKESAAPLGHDGYWIGDHVTGKPKLRISLGEQRVYFYKGAQLVGMSPISSGRESHKTQPGTFHITQKDVDHRSSLYGDYVDADGQVVKADVDVRKDRRPPGSRFLGASMRHFMRIQGAVGMHEGYLPGYPASHGCIRLPGDMAAIFFRETPLGTPVVIVP